MSQPPEDVRAAAILIYALDYQDGKPPDEDVTALLKQNDLWILQHASPRKITSLRTWASPLVLSVFVIGAALASAGLATDIWLGVATFALTSMTGLIFAATVELVLLSRDRRRLATPSATSDAENARRRLKASTGQDLE